jgi:hypothetical protein
LHSTHIFQESIAKMVRISKQAEKRSRSPRRTRAPAKKTGALKDNLPNGYKEHVNALSGDIAATSFIPKIK